MIGIDSNVLLRWLIEDAEAPDQSRRARDALGATREDLYIGPVVLAEVLWVLGARVRASRAAQAELLHLLLDHPRIVLGWRPDVEAALTAFEAGGAGFADHLIGHTNSVAGCRTTLTFDRVAAQGPHFTAIA